MREKVTRPLEIQDDHSCKRQCRQEQIPEYLAEVFIFILIFDTKRVLQMTYEHFLMYAQVAYDEPSVEWEFDTLRPNWLKKVVEERRLLTSNNDINAKYELSLK